MTTLVENTDVKLFHPELDGVYAIFKFITAEMAAEELERLEESQRPRSSAKLEQYKSDRLGGRWSFNGATLCWDEDGFNIDGQHRLWVIKETGIGSWELCVFGLPSGTIDRMDLGLPRNFRTWLARRVKPFHIGVVGATTNMLWNWKQGNYGFNTILRVPYAQSLRVTATSPQLQSVFLQYREEIENAAINAMSIRRRLPVNTITPGVLAFAWMTLRRLDMDKAEAFFHRLQHEEARQGDDNRAIRKLFDQMQTASAAKKAHKRDSWVWLHYVFSAWNAWLLQSPPGAGASYRRPSTPGPRTVALPLHPADLTAEAPEVYA